MIEDILKNLLNQENTYSLAMIFPLMLQIFGLVSAVLIDSYISKKHKRVMLGIAFLAFSLIVQNYAENTLAAGSLKWLARTLVAIWGYSVRPVILVLFLYVISPGRRYGAIWLLVGVNTVVHLTALFSPLCFMIDEQNHYQGGPLHAFCYYVSLFLLCCCVYLTIYEYRHVKKWEMLIPIVNVLLVVGGIILDRNVGYSEQPVTFLTDAVVSGCIFSYIWLHQQFVREHESDLAAQQRIKIMVTQIQPHFLYNTIATFKVLCKKNPEKAAEVADKFGQYLRQNMASLDVQGCIPFRKELEHTRLYTDIEMVRFDHIRVEYDIRDDDFDIPPLTMQPMVENAIRHGVRIREEGIVRVKTRRSAGNHEIIIEDNGIGFDVQAPVSEKDRHIGIRNVRERVEKMCGGSLQIESTEGKGVVVTILIPVQSTLV